MPLRVRKTARVCERCGEHVPARYRALFDQFLCQTCYTAEVREVVVRYDHVLDDEEADT